LFNNTTYKTKFKLLILVLALLLLIVYRLAIIKTIEKYQDCTNLKEKLNLVSLAPREIKELQNRINSINEFFGRNSDSTLNTRAVLIDKTSFFAKQKNIKIKSINEPDFHTENDILIETNQIILEGSFFNLLRYIAFIEKENKNGNIASVKFYTEKNIKTKKEKLLLMIYIKNIIKY